jgi:hypothetical protein
MQGKSRDRPAARLMHPRPCPRPRPRRFANPASLNGATSWVFLNSPENVQHVCATNVKNYSQRYLPVRNPCGQPATPRAARPDIRSRVDLRAAPPTAR